MPRVENEPGSRPALPKDGVSLPDLPARARHDRPGRGALGGDEQAPVPMARARSAAFLRASWIVVVLALVLGLVALRAIDGPTLLQQSLSAALGVGFAVGLCFRSGAQLPLATTLALLVGVTAVLTQWAPLLAGAAIGTAVLAACLAVLATRPASTYPRVVCEVVLAALVATAGGLGAAGFDVRLDQERFAYTVLSLAMVATVALVYRLAGGLHGLGRRGLILVVGALVLLLVVLDYTAALTRYGSSDLILQVRSAQDWTLEHLRGVPHPVEVLVGIPALAWGVSMRSRRRQGWWVCAFGAAATATAATRLVDHGVTARATTLGATYSIVLGLILGYVVIRLERVLTGRGGRGAQVQRQEPPRLQPLH